MKERIEAQEKEVAMLKENIEALQHERDDLVEQVRFLRPARRLSPHFFFLRNFLVLTLFIS